MIEKYNPDGLALPDFYIIGVMKSGTSVLRSMLNSHSGIMMPGGEVHWFDKDDNWKKGLVQYAKRFEKAKENGKIVGEKTPRYINCPTNLFRLYQTTPNAKLIILLRCPTNRWFSHHNHKRGKMDLEQIFWNHQGSITRGMYLGHLQNVFALFNRSQVHIEFTERMRKQTKQSVAKIIDFLGLDSKQDFFTRKRSRGWKADPEWKQRINEVYRPMLPELKSFLDRKGYDVTPIDNWCQN